MRTKKKTVEQEKNRNSQKSEKSVRLMGMGVYGGKDVWKRYVCNTLSVHLILVAIQSPLVR